MQSTLRITSLVASVLIAATSVLLAADEAVTTTLHDPVATPSYGSSPAAMPSRYALLNSYPDGAASARSLVTVAARHPGAASFLWRSSPQLEEPNAPEGAFLDRLFDDRQTTHSPSATLAGVNNCPPAFVWEGPAPGILFGAHVHEIGDINDDGFNELWVGAPAYPLDQSFAFVYSGSDQSLLFRVEGDLNAGWMMGVTSGDINNDGIDDLMFSDPLYDADAINTGRVYVFLGRTEPFDTLIPASTADITIDGEAAEFLGMAVMVLGDLDGDSYDDFAVSSLKGNGMVYLHSGQTMDTLRSWSVEAHQAGFGYFMANAGDVNGDGFDDLLVDAPQHPNWSDSTYGQAYVFSAVDGQLLYHISGDELGDILGWFGTNAAGDLNQDGYADFVLGSQSSDAGGNNSGRAYVFMGGSGPFPVVKHASEADYVFTGSPGSRLGADVTGIEDINGDGYPDLAASAMYFGLSPAGEVHVFSGYDGTKLLTLTGQVNYEDFGYSCIAQWDYDQDGVKDLIIGAACESEYYSGTGPMRGRVYGYCVGDLDVDGASAQCDNCLEIHNPEQSITVSLTGDLDENASLTAGDIIHEVNYVFKSQPMIHPCEAAGDVNCDGSVTSSDIINLVNIVFKSQDPPCEVCQAEGLGWTCP